MNRTKIEEMLKEAKDCIDRADNYRSIDYWRGRKSLLLELLAEEGGEVKESSDVCVWTHTVGLDKFDRYKSPHVGVSYRHGKPDNCLICGKKIVIAPSRHSPIVKDEWISVEERLPEKDKFGMSRDVLTLAETKYEVKCYDYELKRWSGSPHITVKLWQHITPPAPSKGEGR